MKHNSVERVRRHFDEEASRFDAIYDQDKPWHQRLVDSLFRRVVIERYRFVCSLAPVQDRWTVLDVGCGSGRYAIALAKAGASRVVGIDIAEAMVDLARKEAEKQGVSDRCEFIHGEFLEFESSERFDRVLALGYFDYLKEPLPHLMKMKMLCQGHFYASFPRRWEIRIPIRKLRFLLRGGYVRFYSKKQVLALMQETGFDSTHSSLIHFSRDWVLVGRIP